MSDIYYKKCNLGNDLEFSDELINNMLLILVEEASDDFWKILRYGTSDALTQPTVTKEEKYAMIKQNNVTEEGDELTRIKVAKFNNDISTDAHSEIRIFDGSWTIPSQFDYQIAIGVEIISHNKSLILDDVGKRTINVLRHEIYKIFNGAEVDKNIGQMTNVGTRGSVVSFNDNYQGYQMSLTAQSG